MQRVRLKKSIRIGVLSLLVTCGLSVAQENQTEILRNSIGMEFVLIPSGEFQMGEVPRSKCYKCAAYEDEIPRHNVTIRAPFYMSRYEVTQAQWKMVMEENPSVYKHKNRPVENISWYSVQEFIKKLNKMENTNTYRLPAEAEWEYCARAGTKTSYCYGDEPRDLKDYGWYVINSGGKTHVVGTLKPNAWKLYDMHGNVSEWCQDWYSASYYSQKSSLDMVGPKWGAKKTKRGGFWGNSARNCRSSNRDFESPSAVNSATGFRLIKEAKRTR